MYEPWIFFLVLLCIYITYFQGVSFFTVAFPHKAIIFFIKYVFFQNNDLRKSADTNKLMPYMKRNEVIIWDKINDWQYYYTMHHLCCLRIRKFRRVGGWIWLPLTTSDVQFRKKANKLYLHISSLSYGGTDTTSAETYI